VLFRLQGGDEVEHELAEIESVVCKPTGGWSELLAPGTRMALVVGVGLAIFQRITGINTVLYYTPTIIQLAGVPSASGAILATAGIGAVNFMLTVAAMLLLDRIGRRPLLIGGMVVMAAALTALGLTLGFVGQTDDHGVVSVVWLMLYVGAFAISVGPIFWLMIAEIYPLRLRGQAMGVATAANCASNLVVSSTFLTLTDTFGPSRTFWLYGLLTIAAVIFAYKLVPETKGRTLEAIEKFWAPAPAVLSGAFNKMTTCGTARREHSQPGSRGRFGRNQDRYRGVLERCRPSGTAARESFRNREYNGLAAIASEFLDRTNLPVVAACFDVAGPVVSGQAVVTNLPWVVSEGALRDALSIDAIQAVLLPLSHQAPVLVSVPTLGRRELPRPRVRGWPHKFLAGVR
jgi:flagellar biosynthesis protein FliQ